MKKNSYLEMLKQILSEEDIQTIKMAKMGKKAGMGSSPALLIIDGQNYMVGDKREELSVSQERFPSSCGKVGWDALKQIARLVEVCRNYKFPIFYTKMEVAKDGKDMGFYGKKRDFLNHENWFIEGTNGAQISDVIKPSEEDFVLVKKKPSAFFGTPLLSALIDRGIDTLLITGGSTSNCVRASVFDSSSYNFNTIVVEEGVFDRIPLSHAMSLFDMNRQFADVVSIDEAIESLHNLQN